VAASVVKRSLACPALGLRGGARAEKRKNDHDNTLQYSHSMVRHCYAQKVELDNLSWNI
jgi:hypothetical protein